MIKKYIKNWITKGLALTDYVPLGLDVNPALAYLKVGNEPEVDVTHLQFSLAYNPIVIGVVLSAKNIPDPNIDVVLTFRKEGSRRPSSVIDLKLFRKSQWTLRGDSALYLFHLKECSLFQLDLFRRSIILWLRFLSNRHSKKYFGSLPFSLHKQYAALFSFPRRVVLAGVTLEERHKLFPIDLHGCIQDELCVLGLRHSNEAVSLLKNGGKLVIASVAFEDYQSIYAFGKFKQEEKTEVRSLKLIETKRGRIGIPEFVLDYTEIEILDHEDVGSQCLFYGKVLGREKLKNGSRLYHVHLIEYLENYFPGMKLQP